MILETFTRLLETHCTPALVRAAREDPAAADPLDAEIAASGFRDVLMPESLGGAGLTLAEFAPLAMVAGAFLLPVPFARPAIERATGKSLTPDAMTALGAGRMAGVCRRLLDMTIVHVSTRTQFGRPLGAFQAIQHQVSVMAEEVAAATLAAHIGLRGPGFTPERSAIAGLRSSEAADVICAAAHQLHGAIGATAEFDLHLWTAELRLLQRAYGTASAHALQLGRARASTELPSLGFVERILE
jgi:alkylation response protein AidB-like acyl-CoA dehydrogenase